MFSHERDSGGNHRPPALGLPRPLKQEEAAVTRGVIKFPAGLGSETGEHEAQSPGDLSANVSCRADTRRKIRHASLTPTLLSYSTSKYTGRRLNAK